MALYAQEWTAEDSLWLQRVLNGTEQIHLNEATQKAIQSGTLIRDHSITEQLQVNPSEMQIVKHFEGITTTEIQRNYPVDVPVWAPRINNNAFTFSAKTIEEFKALDILTPRKATVDDRSTLRSGSIGISFEDILRTIFWPSHRAKKRNAQNADAWKTISN